VYDLDYQNCDYNICMTLSKSNLYGLDYQYCDNTRSVYNVCMTLSINYLYDLDYQ